MKFRKPLIRSLPFLIAALFFAGCPKQEGPMAEDTRLGPATRMGDGSGGVFIGNPSGTGGDSLNPDTFSSDFSGQGMSGGLNGGLEPRGSNTTGSNSGMGGGADSGDVLASIYFGFDEFNIRSSERSKLSDISDQLRSSNVAIITEGHTDWMGTEQYNLGLADRRANSVRDYLVSLGIPANRIDILAKGELDSTEGLSKSEAMQDRRVDVIAVR